MGNIEKLDDAEVESRLGGLDGWSLQEGKLHREYQFANFIEAFGFMTKVAIVAESADHHPEWFNVYRTVRIDLTTHEASGISERDFDLARKIDELAS